MGDEKKRRAMLCWSLYEGGLYPYHYVIISSVFSAYFINRIAPTHAEGTAMLAYVVAFSALLTALASLIAGPILDRTGRHKVWLGVSTFIFSVSSAALFFSYPSPESINWTLLWLAIGLLMLNLSPVFHNGMLKNFPENVIGTLSGWGWSCKLLAGFVSMLLALLFSYLAKNWFPPSLQESMVARISALFIALWAIVFSIPLFIFMDDTKKSLVPQRKLLQELIQSVKAEPQIAYSQLCRLFYQAGIVTIMLFISLYLFSWVYEELSG